MNIAPLKREIDQIAKDKGIDRDTIIGALEEAMRQAARKKFGLEREIEALSRLRNPHIVPFYVVLELPGNFLGVVMDYVEGVTLENLIHQNDAATIERTCSIARQIAIGVHEAHEAGNKHAGDKIDQDGRKGHRARNAQSLAYQGHEQLPYPYPTDRDGKDAVHEDRR